MTHRTDPLSQPKRRYSQPSTHGKSHRQRIFSSLPPIRQWGSAHKPIWTPTSNSVSQNQICPGNRRYFSYCASKCLSQSSHPPHQNFNNILRFWYFPCVWKSAKVIPILKPGKPLSDPGSQTAISPLSSVSRLTERVVTHRLNSFIHQNHVLPPEKFGSRKQHSTTSQLTRITDCITRDFNFRKHTGMVLLDIEKAYNILWLNGLLFKLISLHLPDYLLFFFKSYLDGRTFTVHLNDSTSTPKPTPPAFLRVLYYLLHFSPFIFLTCRALHTPTSHYTQMTLPFISVLAAWYYIPQIQSHCSGLTQILHYMETPIKYPQNWNYFIFLAPSLHPGPYSKPVHLCALGFGRPPSRPCAKFKTPLHPAPAHRSQ